jgi:DNA-binding response OmpR family regulator
MHGGTIAVESDEKRGTVFMLDFPVTPANMGSPAEETKAEPLPALVPETASMEDSFDPTKPAVLVIDDNTDIRSYIHGLLAGEFTVLEASDGTEGLCKAVTYVPDVIVSDVMMPGIDGLECCRRLKAELQTCHIPVILLTACSLDEQRIQGYDVGADSYISKPFSAQVLLSRIRNLVNAAKRLRQSVASNPLNLRDDACDMDKAFIDKFKQALEAKMGNSALNVEDLGKEMNLSRVQLYRKVKALTNTSPNELLRRCRLQKGAALLTSSGLSISEICYEVGFTSPSYFAKCYKDEYGESPTDFIKRTKGKR